MADTNVPQNPLLEQLGIADLNLMWIVDEFDASFDRLIMASMQYHLHHAVATHPTPNELQQLFDAFQRLHEPRDPEAVPGFAHYAAHVEELGFFAHLNNDCVDCERHLAASAEADRAWRDRQKALRHRFVDLLPSLWS